MVQYFVIMSTVHYIMTIDNIYGMLVILSLKSTVKHLNVLISIDNWEWPVNVILREQLVLVTTIYYSSI